MARFAIAAVALWLLVLAGCAVLVLPWEWEQDGGFGMFTVFTAMWLLTLLPGVIFAGLVLGILAWVLAHLLRSSAVGYAICTGVAAAIVMLAFSLAFSNYLVFQGATALTIACTLVGVTAGAVAAVDTKRLSNRSRPRMLAPERPGDTRETPLE